MRFTGLLSLAGLIAGAMVIGIAAILLNGWHWSNAAIGSIVLLAIAVASVFHLPVILTARLSGSDARQMATLGPLAAITSLTMVLAAAAFALSLNGLDQLAWAANAFTVGTFLICALFLRAVWDKVGDVSTRHSAPSRHLQWQAALQQMAAAATDSSVKAALERLAETLRYSPSDVPGGSPQDGKLDQAIAELGDSLAGNGANADTLRKIESLIAQREVFLRAARSKA